MKKQGVVAGSVEAMWGREPPVKVGPALLGGFRGAEGQKSS